MKSRSQKIRLGLFVAVSSAILLALAGMFTTQKLLQKKDIYFVAFEGVSVSGLESGSPVKLLGIKVGSVQDIRIDPKDVNRVIIKIGLAPETPVKADAEAVITTQGITGLKAIEIRGGTNEAPYLQKSQFLQQGSSVTEDITGRAEVIAEKVEVLLNNLNRLTQGRNMDKIIQMIDTVTVTAASINKWSKKADRAVSNADAILAENRDGIRSTVAASQEITQNLLTSSRQLEESIAKINRLVNSDTLDEIMGGAREAAIALKQSNLKELIGRLDEMVKQTNDLLGQVDQDLSRGSEDFSESMVILKSTLENLNEASRLINQDPSVLIRGTHYTGGPDKQLKE